MTALKRIEKVRFKLETIINRYFYVDRQLQLLLPILFDKGLYRTWDETPGVEALETLRLSLYQSVLSNIHAIMFDNSKNAASMVNVIKVLEDQAVVKQLKVEFTKYPGLNVINSHELDEETIARLERDSELRHIAEKTEVFDRVLKELFEQYHGLLDSKLYQTVKKSRDKTISHIEVRTVGGKKELYSPGELGLVWGAAKEIVEASRDVIFDSHLLLNNGSYHLESFLNGHVEASQSFWSKLK